MAGANDDPVIDDRLPAKLTALLQGEADRFRERARPGIRVTAPPLARSARWSSSRRVS
jgi:hypothetical protein